MTVRDELDDPADLDLERALRGVRRLLRQGILSLDEADLAVTGIIIRWDGAAHRSQASANDVPEEIVALLVDTTFPRALSGPLRFLTQRVQRAFPIQTLDASESSTGWSVQPVEHVSVAGQLCSARLVPAGRASLDGFAAAVSSIVGARHLDGVGCWVAELSTDSRGQDEDLRCALEIDADGAVVVSTFNLNALSEVVRLVSVQPVGDHVKATVDSLVDRSLDSLATSIMLRNTWSDSHPSWGRPRSDDIWILGLWPRSARRVSSTTPDLAEMTDFLDSVDELLRSKRESGWTDQRSRKILSQIEAWRRRLRGEGAAT